MGSFTPPRRLVIQFSTVTIHDGAAFVKRAPTEILALYKYEQMFYNVIYRKGASAVRGKQSACCFTGHRPAKLPWGYDESDERCRALKAKLCAAAESAILEGTEHFICKSMFAPAGETGQLDALAENVHDLGAARIVQLD